MIPSRFVSLESLPLTPNGKVDRKALEKLEGLELGSGTDYVAPRNERERELAEIWRAVLRREQVGIQDNFFELGGHSLLAVVICSQIQRRLGLATPLRWVFEHPTIEGLARQLESLGRHSQDPGAIEKADRQKPLPMSFAQQGMWLLQQTLPDPATYNQPIAWHFSGQVDRERVRRALQAILERHEVLRTALVQQGEDLVQRVGSASEVPLPWQEMDLQAVPPGQKEAVLEEWLLAEARRPFDLAWAPLWRVVWLELAGDEHVLVLTFHHSIEDEWSKRLFFQELERFYVTGGQTERAGLPELPVQYADYAAWQRRRLAGELLERQRAYWSEQLRDLPPALELPADRARPSRPSGRGAVHDFQITGSVVTRLRELAREEGTTLFTVMLAAFQVWLHRYTGQTDMVVGTPITSRNRPELQSLLGFFLNTLPIR
ncbi:MAG: condensation domain-containing protein, partial [Verrucomicrobia bacterium]|nr:condensation domain-containing protein [Verrucomicrobiota bacterium]